MNLYIIGNGFDLAHDLPTKYWDFRIYLEENYPFFLQDFEEKYYILKSELGNMLWNNLESNLENIQDDVIFEQMYQNTDLGLETGDIGITDTLTYYFNSEFEYIEKMTEYLKEWINNVNAILGNIKKLCSVIDLTSQDIYINFNYTSTLQQVYGIAEKNIYHIHGSAHNDEDLLLGHSSLDRISYFHDKGEAARNNYDERCYPIYNQLAAYCRKTYKDVYKNMDIFSYINLKPVEKVIIVGHSLSAVDLPYFNMIREKVNETVNWYVYYLFESEKTYFAEQLNEIGIKDARVKLLPSAKLFDLSSLYNQASHLK